MLVWRHSEGLDLIMEGPKAKTMVNLCLRFWETLGTFYESGVDQNAAVVYLQK